MNGIVKIAVIAAVVGGIYLYSNNDSGNEAALVANEIDLKRVLDVTVDTIVGLEAEIEAMPEGSKNPDAAFLMFSQKLGQKYNETTPALHDKMIGVAPLVDASLIAFEDLDNNGEQLEGTEDALFMIEIDGENSRIVATSRTGAVADHATSGIGGFLTGYLIGSMLSRQRVSGNPASVSNKKPVSAAQARSRAGSGSHSRGK